MRTKKELYKVVLKSLEKGYKANYYNNGICGEIEDLYYQDELLTQEEYRFLYNDFKQYDPAKNPLFKKYQRSKFYIKGGGWWFVRMRKESGGRNVRIRLVKGIIKNLSDEN